MGSPTPPSWLTAVLGLQSHFLFYFIFSAEDNIFGGRRHFRRKTTFPVKMIFFADSGQPTQSDQLSS